jgi:hypothetical protein
MNPVSSGIGRIKIYSTVANFGQYLAGWAVGNLAKILSSDQSFTSKKIIYKLRVFRRSPTVG